MNDSHLRWVQSLKGRGQQLVPHRLRQRVPPRWASRADHRRDTGGAGRTVRWLRRVLVGVLSVVLLGVGATSWALVHLNGNIKTVPISAAIAGTETPHVKPPTQGIAKGGMPINVLVIGSDTRGSAADCTIGGDCSPAASTAEGKAATSGTGNADVEMVVHISADRSNASIVSVPRDTVVGLPPCTDPETGKPAAAATGRINSSLQYGPACTVATVHQVTGLPIDHFVVLDFSGVITMSDAVGGVNICVDNNVYDTYSHLKLAKGSHTLKGKAALEFLRTRHGFGDGSDIGRTVAQHLFLSAMLRKLQSASTLANPLKVYGLADAATNAVTVDPGLGDIGKLTGLARQLNSIPASRITFTTLPTVPDPRTPSAVVMAPDARALLTKIKDDVSLSTAPATTGVKPSVRATSKRPTAPPKPSSGVSDYSTTVDKATGCAQVSHFATVEINGVVMNPIQAYAQSPTIPNSAP